MFTNTEKFAIIKSPLGKLKIDLKIIFKNDTDFSIEEIDQSHLEEQKSIICKSKYDGDRFIIWEPLGLKDCSIFYSNFLDGWYTLLYNLAKQHNNEIFMIYLGEIEKKGKMGFYYYNNEKERVVRTMYDNKWIFFEKGKMLSFEKPEYYEKKRITDRINNDILKEYLLSLNVDINKDIFYTSKGNLLVGKEIK